ncbi:MAG: phage tail protein, partial [Candidatus Dactylopiibacterium carminicum]
MQFTIEFQADHLTRALEAIRQEIATPQEMLGSFGESLQFVNEERHRQGLDPDGQPWKELAASTLAEGKRKGGPLNKTGRMLASFHYQVIGDDLRLGFDDGDGFKAKFHQDGSRAHVITPKKAKALNIGGAFYKRVN